MAVRSIIKKDVYRDSIFLMKLSSQAAAESGVELVSAMMATARNKDLFEASGLATPEILAARPNDLAIAIQEGEGAVDGAVEAVMRLLDAEPEKPVGDREADRRPATLRQAASRPGHKPNLALISVAGDYARFEAAEALELGMDVMLYSDNISLADELALKRMARKKGLLVMGPDCGTAIVDGVPLAFANNCAKGPIGLVGASGTGLQEVCCLLDRLGVGVAQAYGVGGRDLRDGVGGITALDSLDRLAGDPGVEALVVLGKPPGADTRRRLRERLQSFGKPAFIHYIGADDYADEEKAGLIPAADLTDLAIKAAGRFRPGAALAEEGVETNISPRPGFLAGIFGGGTLCQEAAEICGRILSGPKASNLKVAGFAKVAGSDRFAGHVFWDLGEDEFTVGRPHPMMAPELKLARMTEALCDPAVAAVLVDLVVGHGSHPEQAELTAAAMAEAERKSRGASRGKPVIASVCGTEKDRPRRSAQAETLRRAGVVVPASNALAARLAAKSVGVAAG